jgi:hypothetical protein
MNNLKQENGHPFGRRTFFKTYTSIRSGFLLGVYKHAIP